MLPVYPPIYSPTGPRPARTIPLALKASLEVPDLCLLITATDRKSRVLGRLTGHELNHGELVPRAYPPPHKYVFMA